MVSNKAIIIDKPEKLSIIPKDNIPLEIEHDYSVGVTMTEFYREREIVCKEQQEEGYVLDKDFVKDNRIYTLLITPEDINKKYGSNYRFGIIWLDKPSIDDWE